MHMRNVVFLVDETFKHSNLISGRFRCFFLPLLCRGEITMNHYDDYHEYDDQQANNFPQIDILELSENDLKQFFQLLNKIINFNFKKNFQLESSGSNMVWEISCPTSVWDNTNHDLHLFLLLPFFRSCMCAYFSFFTFFVHRNAADPVGKFSPRLHMVGSTFSIQFQIHLNSFNSLLIHIHLCNFTLYI